MLSTATNEAGRGGEIYGTVVTGFFEWASVACKHFTLVIYSSRSKTEGGIVAMRSWMENQIVAWAKQIGIIDGQPNTMTLEQARIIGELHNITFAHEKPPAYLTIDDRALQFRGDWSAWWLAPKQLLKFRPWTMDPTPLTCDNRWPLDDENPGGWRSIETAPENEWVEVTGDSRVKYPPHFIALAKHDTDYHPRDPWCGVLQDAFSDYGWTPTHWRPASNFPKVRE